MKTILVFCLLISCVLGLAQTTTKNEKKFFVVRNLHSTNMPFEEGTDNIRSVPAADLITHVVKHLPQLEGLQASSSKKEAAYLVEINVYTPVVNNISWDKTGFSRNGDNTLFIVNYTQHITLNLKDITGNTLYSADLGSGNEYNTQFSFWINNPVLSQSRSINAPYNTRTNLSTVTPGAQVPQITSSAAGTAEMKANDIRTSPQRYRFPDLTKKLLELPPQLVKQ
ncbi:MAG: hypothetical protein SFU21_08350 [Flavihumibacter sp.]|nr:hypothetical protein [Flavihumibacter sp.]